MSDKCEENVKFIKTVNERPALWDHGHHLHSDKKVCEALWESIGSKFNLSSTSAKSRWKNLRDNFRRELRRSSLGFVGSTPEAYNSPWRYFPHMFFVKDQLRQNNIVSPLIMHAQHNSVVSSGDESSTSRPGNVDPEVSIVETTHDAFVTEFPKVSSTKETKSSKKNGDELPKAVTEAMVASIDPDLGFLSSLLPHIRSVPQNKKGMMKSHIFRVVMHYLEGTENGGPIVVCDDSGPDSVNDEVEDMPVDHLRSSTAPAKRKSLTQQGTGLKKMVVSSISLEDEESA